MADTSSLFEAALQAMEKRNAAQRAREDDVVVDALATAESAAVSALVAWAGSRDFHDNGNSYFAREAKDGKLLLIESPLNKTKQRRIE